MIIRILNKKTELDTVNNWMPFKVEAKDLPGHTFAVEVKKEIVAIGALRLMEGELCYIDSFATKQEVDGKIRNEAINNLINHLFELAKNLGFKKAFATTVEECVLKRGIELGAKITNHKVLVKEL